MKWGLALVVFALQAAGLAWGSPLEPWHPEAPAHLRSALPADAARDAERLALAGEGYTVLHTAHYSIVHHVDSKTAAYRASILEDLYAAFTSYFNKSGSLRHKPSTKLAVLYTPTRQVFVELSLIHI